MWHAQEVPEGGAGERNLGIPRQAAGPERPVTARLTRSPGGAARLRALLDSGQVIVAPGAFDSLSARLVEEAGFPAVYMTGFGTSAALIGRPDAGLLTMSEMAGQRRPDRGLRGHPGDCRC